MQFNVGLKHANSLLHKVYRLARPYGRMKIGLVLGVSMVQGIFQVIGITSIFPFLALAADPDRMRDSQFGNRVIEWLPPMDNTHLLVISGTLTVALMLLANFFNLLSEMIRGRYAYNYAHWLRLQLIKQIASQPYGYFLEHNSAIFHHKVTNDVMEYTKNMLLPLLDIFASIVTIVLLGSLLLIVDFKIAVSAIVILGGFYAVVFMFLGTRRKLAMESLMKAGRGLGQEILQFFTGIKAVKVHRAEEFFVDRLSAHSSMQARLFAWIPVYSRVPRYFIEPLVFGGLVMYIVVLSTQGRNITEILPLLGVIALAGYRLLPALQLLYGQLTQVTSWRHTLDEVYDEFQEAEGKIHGNIEHRFQAQSPLKWNHTVRLENVTFTYPLASVPVLDSINLTIEKGSSNAIVGATGSGKSTLIDLMLGLHIPDAGRIMADDTLISDENFPAWRASIGYVPQEIFLIDDTVTRNIAFGVSDDAIDQARVREVCRTAQILDFIEKELPFGFQTRVGDRGVRISGGQRQRIGLARALYHKPLLLILDEATSALDEVTERAMVEAINKLTGKTTIIAIAHRPSTIEGCQYRWDIDHGTVRPYRADSFMEGL
jgi:ABC-type multidrug transport system fused ATPase/permease subunit